MQPNHGTKFELLELSVWPDENGWRTARVAVDGIPSIPFQFHQSVVEEFKTDDELIDYVMRQGANMVERYGDGRYPKNFDEERVN